MRAQDLTTAKTVAKISVVSNTAGGKKSVARRSTGLDFPLGGGVKQSHRRGMMNFTDLASVPPTVVLGRSLISCG